MLALQGAARAAAAAPHRAGSEATAGAAAQAEAEDGEEGGGGGDEVAALRARLRRADAYTTALAAAVEGLEGAIKAMGDDHATELAARARADRLPSGEHSPSREGVGELPLPLPLPLPAVEKLRVRSAVRGRLVGIYRHCLLALQVRPLQPPSQRLYRPYLAPI